MTNFNLNLGGLIGALLGVALIGAIVFLAVQPQEFPRMFGRLTVFGIIGGAVAGNFGWAAVMGKK